jgi:hypothetical protein
MMVHCQDRLWTSLGMPHSLAALCGCITQKGLETPRLPSEMGVRDEEIAFLAGP